MRYRAFSTFLLFCAISSSFVFAKVPQQATKTSRLPLTADGERWVRETMKGLTLDEKVGQMLQARYFSDYGRLNDPAYIALRKQIQDLHIGSLVYGMHFDRSGPLRSSAIEAARVANQLQSGSKLPLLLAADLERGVATRVDGVPSLPWPMAFGADGDIADTARFGVITGHQARAIGIHWALAPDADVNNNPRNPVINTRSFGEDPERVAKFVAAFIRGAHESGLLVTAKHFPGQGNTSIDAHKGIPSVDGNLEMIRRIELQPFASAIGAGVDSILVAHTRVPAIETDDNKVATTSAKVVTQLLKRDLGFEGVVISDALEMRGVNALYDPQHGDLSAQVAIDAVKAGCDVIMVPANMEAAFNGIVNAVRSGEISESRIDESVKKILAMKAAVGLHKQRLVDVEKVDEIMSEPESKRFVQAVADKAVTLVRDNGIALPIKSNDPKVVTIILGKSLERENGKALEAAMKVRLHDTKVFFADDRSASAPVRVILDAVAAADHVIVAAYVSHLATRAVSVAGRAEQSFGLPGASGALLRTILVSSADKSAVVAFGSPYLIEGFPAIKTYLCAYGMTPGLEDSAVKIIFGELEARGKLPVSLPNIADRDFGLQHLRGLNVEKTSVSPDGTQ